MATKHMTVNEVIKMLTLMKQEKLITGKTKVTLASDEEGNEFNPFATINGQYHVALPDEESDELILYPIHSY